MPRAVIRKFYTTLFEAFGPQYWWPGESPFEVVIGAILTQNTNWRNVERALANLKECDKLSPQDLRDMPAGKLGELIRPAGYYNLKAKRVKNFIDFLFERYDGDLNAMADVPTDRLRREILAVNGVGPETADSILLYALQRPVFVIDAYTKRLLYRHGLVDADARYSQMQDIFQDALDEDRELFNEYHALIVRMGKDYCRPVPRCEHCPLNTVSYSIQYRCGRCYRTITGEGGGSKKNRGGLVCGRCHERPLSSG